MRFRWTLFGHEITTVECGEPSVEEIAELVDNAISGGTSQNFERDGNPADPNERYRYEDRKLGFGC